MPTQEYHLKWSHINSFLVQETCLSGGYSNDTENAAFEDGPFPGHRYSAKHVDKLVATSTKLAASTSGQPEHAAESKELTRALLPFYLDKQLSSEILNRQ